MRPNRCRLAFALFSLVLAGAGQAAQPAIESFFNNAAFTGALLSPNARFLAVKVAPAGQRDALAVIDLASNAIKVAARFDTSDVGQFSWVSDERLLFNATDKHVAPGEVRYGSGLFAVDRDGLNFRQLAERSGARVTNGQKFHDAVKATNAHVEMVVYQEEGHGWTLPKNRIDFWGRAEKFLDQHIGKP